MNKAVGMFLRHNNEQGYLHVIVNNQQTLESLEQLGWVRNVELLPEKNEKQDMSEEERSLRDEYEKLTGKVAGGRAKIETLRKMVSEAKNADNEGQSS